MRDDHHEFECKLYDRILKRICRNCIAGYHYDSECVGRKDNRTNVTAVTLAEMLALEYKKKLDSRVIFKGDSTDMYNQATNKSE